MISDPMLSKFCLNISSVVFPTIDKWREATILLRSKTFVKIIITPSRKKHLFWTGKLTRVRKIQTSPSRITTIIFHVSPIQVFHLYFQQQNPLFLDKSLRNDTKKKINFISFSSSFLTSISNTHPNCNIVWISFLINLTVIINYYS